MNDFSHLDKSGLVTMVDVSEKKVSHRLAVAQSIVVLPDEVLQRFSEGDIQTKKGSVFQTAIIAGIMAAKKTGELIP
ncbi:MAG TPA: cyclic pyranopterin monophosphate synthase MoaC, partial [Chitinophagales bacterium]|nr:cyclic pyranopterin monophosphate synthase MoaC [Chitinophagales bacterium]